MKRVFLAACLLLAPACARAQTDPEEKCAGVDLVERMRSADPGAFAAYEKDIARIPNLDGLLWRVEKPGAPPSYLFGTMHVDDRDALMLARSTKELVRGSRIVLTELGDVDETTQRQAAGAVIAKAARRDGGALAVVVDPQDLAEVKRLLVVQKLNVEAADHIAPWVTIMMLALPACERARIGPGMKTVDSTVIEIAHAANVPVAPIESMEEQLKLLSTMDEKLVARDLVSTARHPALIEDGFATVLRLYKEKRVGAMLAVLHRAARLTKQENEDNEAMMKAFAGSRNRVIAARVKPEIEKGGAFVAVGAAHLSGFDGLVALVREAGYTATKEW